MSNDITSGFFQTGGSRCLSSTAANSSLRDPIALKTPSLKAIDEFKKIHIDKIYYAVIKRKEKYIK